MFKLKAKLLLILCICVLFSFLTPPASVSDLIEKLEAYLAYYTPEKVYVHHDKPYYSAGDTIWFATYLTHGISHMASAPSKLVYVEVVSTDGSVVAKRDIFISEGSGSGDIALPDTLASDTYELRAYTSFMRNFDHDFFFRKELRIENTQSPSFDEADVSGSTAQMRSEEMMNLSDLVRLQFFPEGGDLVEGLWSTVGFKATGPDGKGVDIEGEVSDNTGKKIADIKTSRFGMGKFLMQPVAGESYKVTFKFGMEKMQVPLPTAKPSGYVMTMTNVSPKYVTLKVEGAGGESTDGGAVVGHVRGVVFLTLPASDGQPLQGLIPKENLPEGVAQFTFFDKKGQPQAERIVYIDQPDKRPVARVDGLQATYKKRSKVDLAIMMAEADAASTSHLSVAVVDKSKVQFDPHSDDIVSYLLMTSDIKGDIENPGYYFDEDNKDRVPALDNLMLTQGWRRFTWKDIMEDKKPDINHLVEPGFSIAGRVTDFFFPSKPVKSKVTITGTEADGDLWSAETEADDDGYFLFTALDIDDTARVVIQTPNEKKMSKKGGKKDFVEGGNVNLATKIVVNETKSPEIKYGEMAVEELVSSKAIAAYLEEARKVREVEAAFAKQDVVILDEMQVEGERVRTGERFNKPGMTYKRPTRRVDVDSISRTTQFLSIFEVFIGRTPGVRVVGSYPNYDLIIRGSSSLQGGSINPLYVLNGSIVDASFINTIPVDRVDFVDVLTGTGATMYGSMGAGGVVAVYLKDGSEVDESFVPKGSLGMIHPGFYHAREFYTPDYSTKKESHVRTDIRPTLYWKGGLKTAEGVPAKLEFYTSDVASTFEVRVEGITEDGRPFVKKEEFVVN
ncbi:MAG: TonB-dependent receptor plug domain-containing protein [Imperialibacter sp.]|uniref:TonB-dependent receptor n=1 Tax=Imperialibacter sp. TaxID=2038411 RepID=UPI003A8B044C